MKICSIVGCERSVGSKGARGMCSMHYKRWNYRGGDPAQKFCDPASDVASLKTKFSRKWILDESTGCWEWTGAKMIKGRGPSDIRGEFKIACKKVAAHRAAWVIYKGPIPDRMWVLHTCDNSLCVNPEHLYLGDHDKNMEDVVRRRRSGRIKVSAEQVLMIRNSPLSAYALSKQLGFNKSTVLRVRRGETHRFTS